MAEVQVVNAETGGVKGSKDERYDLLPWDVLAADARLYHHGSKKYDERNWERGYNVSLSFAALMRHLTLWWDGEDVDPETGCNHMSAVRFHAAAMYRFTQGGLPSALDNRPGRSNVSEPVCNGDDRRLADGHWDSYPG